MLATTFSNSTRIVTSHIQYAADLNPKPNRNNPNNLLEANILTGYNVRLESPNEFIIILLKIAHKAGGDAYAANKGCPSYERERDDGFLLIFTSKIGIISCKRHQGHIGNLL